MTKTKLTCPVWIVTPHEDGEFDEWWGPADTEEDHDRALAYALARLEEQAYECSLDGPVAKVTICCTTVTTEDFEWSQQ